MMPLTFAKTDETVVISKISGPENVRRHLAEMGFAVGGSVTAVNEIAGSLILQVKSGLIRKG
ncbi:MAG: FeoA family protein [Anaerovoracaceae bacterium]|nr:FeoA family protein [Anaerovoracaceae bacterium]